MLESGGGEFMAFKVLHLLSQRPSFTGSGVSLDAIVRLADRAGWEQRVVVAAPAEDAVPAVGGLAPEHVRPLVFGHNGLDFPIPGMSDVMPYPSTRFSSLGASQLETYRRAWRQHVGEVVAEFRPDLIHSRHVWLLSSMIKDVAPQVPVVTHCHATGLRQMSLCPHLADEVQRGCRRNDRFFVLHGGHAEQLASKLDVARDRIHIVGAGYQDGVFHTHQRQADGGSDLLYVGKYSHAKGLPQLLDSIERLAGRRGDLVLHVAGDGAGAEADALRSRMAAMAPRVMMHGQLDQPALADLMRRCAVFVLPSFYEGLPLVLIEALACGCRVVCSDLPGIREGFGVAGDGVLNLVPLPRLVGIDTPDPDDLPGFVDTLATAIESALDRRPTGGSAHPASELLKRFTWASVFHRIERVWSELATSPPS